MRPETAILIEAVSDKEGNVKIHYTSGNMAGFSKCIISKTETAFSLETIQVLPLYSLNCDNLLDDGEFTDLTYELSNMPVSFGNNADTLVHTDMILEALEELVRREGLSEKKYKKIESKVNVTTLKMGTFFFSMGS